MTTLIFQSASAATMIATATSVAVAALRAVPAHFARDSLCRSVQLEASEPWIRLPRSAPARGRARAAVPARARPRACRRGVLLRSVAGRRGRGRGAARAGRRDRGRRGRGAGTGRISPSPGARSSSCTASSAAAAPRRSRSRERSFEVERSLPGRILGYGTVVAGELEIDCVPRRLTSPPAADCRISLVPNVCSLGRMASVWLPKNSSSTAPASTT